MEWARIEGKVDFGVAIKNKVSYSEEEKDRNNNNTKLKQPNQKTITVKPKMPSQTNPKGQHVPRAVRPEVQGACCS